MALKRVPLIGALFIFTNKMEKVFARYISLVLEQGGISLFQSRRIVMRILLSLLFLSSSSILMSMYEQDNAYIPEHSFDTRYVIAGLKVLSNDQEKLRLKVLGNPPRKSSNGQEAIVYSVVPEAASFRALGTQLITQDELFQKELSANGFSFTIDGKKIRYKRAE
jgi:hypothetical protein